MQDTIFSGSEMPEMKKGKIAVNSEFETSLQGLWSGGDCVKSGEDLTVQAVEDGKRAANSIHKKIMQQ
jgi:glutamate synthase (NADPH/NADH) small chain